MLLSEQIAAKNFRLRESLVGYKTKWHLSGDPTLILIQQGILRVTLQNNQFETNKNEVIKKQRLQCLKRHRKMQRH